LSSKQSCTQLYLCGLTVSHGAWDWQAKDCWRLWNGWFCTRYTTSLRSFPYGPTLQQPPRRGTKGLQYLNTPHWSPKSHLSWLSQKSTQRILTSWMICCWATRSACRSIGPQSPATQTFTWRNIIKWSSEDLAPLVVT
jgi:hypothetical protein